MSNEPKKKEINWTHVAIAFLVVYFLFMVVNSFFDSQEKIAKIYYESSLTPEEREALHVQIAAEEAAKKEADKIKAEQDAQFWNDFVTKPVYPQAVMFIVMPILVLITAHTFMRRRY